VGEVGVVVVAFVMGVVVVKNIMGAVVFVDDIVVEVVDGVVVLI
jgi:hypothetical protein